MKDAGKATSSLSFAANKTILDPNLASLFAGSLGPVIPPPKSRYQSTPAKQRPELEQAEDDEDLSSLDSTDGDKDAEDSVDGDDISEDNESESDTSSELEQPQSDEDTALARLQESVINATQAPLHKKRKRGDREEEVEDRYMRKIAREEAKEDEKRAVEQEKKRQKLENDGNREDDEGASDSGASSNSSKSHDGESVDSDEEAYSIPQHETLAPSKDEEEIEKAGRTVFLGNVSTQAITSKTAKKTLLNHLASFIPSLSEHKPPHKVESIRFRSTAFASTVPKKAAFAKKELMDATTKSTNAYAVYSTQIAAREAAKRLNGTIVLDRHLRVDEVAHPSKTDHRRCVFVGNLGFVDDESALQSDQNGERKKKNKQPGDVEEGLWVQFAKAGTVESVRVVRDPKTRVGKGFAYVQFTDENGVEAALQFNDQKYPPLLPRKLRVVRAKGIKRNAKKATPTWKKSSNSDNPNNIYIPKVSDQQKSMQGRAGKLLGRAGATQVRHDRKPSSAPGSRSNVPFKSPESFVFEGHRASSKQGTAGLKLGGRKKGGKPKTRSSKRGAAWKAGGGKKPGK